MSESNKCCEKCNDMQGDQSCEDTTCPCHSPTDTRTSDVDTTLREKFYSWASDYDGTKSTYDADTVIDFFLAEFHQLMNEKREAIEGMKKRIELPMNQPQHQTIPFYNQALDDVLSILKE